MVVVQILIDIKKEVTGLSCYLLRREDASEAEYEVAKIFEKFTNDFVKGLEKYAKTEAKKTFINDSKGD